MNKSYFACHIEDSFLTVAVWSITNGKAHVLATGTPKEWQELSQLSDALEVAMDELQEKADGVSEVFFAVPNDWIEKDELKPEFSKALDTLTQKLKLEAAGFISSTEAVVHFLASQQKGVFSGILIDFEAHAMSVALILRNEIRAYENVGRSESMAEDLVEGLARIQAPPYPAQLYFYSALLSLEELDKQKNELLSHEWQNDNPFHHMPTVNLLTRKHLMGALCLSGAAFLSQTPVSSSSPVPTKTESTPVADNFGFEQVRLAKAAPAVPPAPPVPPVPAKAEVVEEEMIEDEEELEEQPKKSRFALPFSLPFLKKKKLETDDVEVMDEEPEYAVDDVKKKRPRWQMIAVALFLVIVIGAGVGAFFLRKSTQAQVIVTLDTEQISTKTPIEIDPEADETNPEKKILKASEVTETVEGQQEMSTTGSKIIGEKAKGKVTLYNRTESDKTFAQGTELTAGDVVFLLDDEVTVASGTAKEDDDFNKTLEPGKKEVNVTAEEIGAEGNVAESTEFTVANYAKDTYVARNESAMSGGTSREIQAVSEQDMKKLKDSVLEELLGKAGEELKSSLDEGEYLVESDSYSIKKEEFNAKAGDETNTLRLFLSIEVSGYSYRAEDLKPIAEAVLKDQLPEGASLLPDKIDIMSRPAEDASSSAEILLDAEITAEYAKQTNEEQWKNAIVNKTSEQAVRLLEEMTEIKTAEVKISPYLSHLVFGKLPGSIDKISLETKTE